MFCTLLLASSIPDYRALACTYEVGIWCSGSAQVYLPNLGKEHKESGNFRLRVWGQTQPALNRMAPERGGDIVSIYIKSYTSKYTCNPLFIPDRLLSTARFLTATVCSASRLAVPSSLAPVHIAPVEFAPAAFPRMRLRLLDRSSPAFRPYSPFPCS